MSLIIFQQFFLMIRRGGSRFSEGRDDYSNLYTPFMYKRTAYFSRAVSFWGVSLIFFQNDKVMAVFPDTTMFYCATVAMDTPQKENSKVRRDPCPRYETRLATLIRTIASEKREFCLSFYCEDCLVQ